MSLGLPSHHARSRGVSTSSSGRAGPSERSVLEARAAMVIVLFGRGPPASLATTCMAFGSIRTASRCVVWTGNRRHGRDG